MTIRRYFKDFKSMISTLTLIYTIYIDFGKFYFLDFLIFLNLGKCIFLYQQVFLQIKSGIGKHVHGLSRHYFMILIRSLSFIIGCGLLLIPWLYASIYFTSTIISRWVIAPTISIVLSTLWGEIHAQLHVFNIMLVCIWFQYLFT